MHSKTLKNSDLRVLFNVSGHGKVDKNRIGGVEKIVLDRSTYLARHDFFVSIFGDFPWETPNVNKVRFRGTMGGSLKHIHKIFLYLVKGYRKLKNETTDVLVSTHERNYLLTLLVAKKRKIPVLDLEADHDPWVPPFSISKRLYHWLVEKADRVVAISEEAKRRMISLGISKENIDVVYPGIDTNIYKPGSPKKRKQQIMYVAKFVERKNHLALLRAFNEIKKQLPELRLVFIGPKSAGYTGNTKITSNYFRNCRKFIKAHNLQGRIDFYEDLSEKDLISLYQESKLFVIPSSEEGFGLTLLEAMSCGCACIVNNVPPMTEVIGNAGILLDVNDTETLADAISEILKNKEKQKMLQTLARTRAQEVFDAEKMNKKFRESMVELIGDEYNRRQR